MSEWDYDVSTAPDQEWILLAILPSHGMAQPVAGFRDLTGKWWCRVGAADIRLKNTVYAYMRIPRVPVPGFDGPSSMGKMP